MKRTKGLQGRWLRNTLSLVLALVLLCVTALSVTVAAYYYSNMEAGMESKARTGTAFFETYIGQSYNEYYQSCAKFTQSFDAKDVMELITEVRKQVKDKFKVDLEPEILYLS